MEDQSIISSAIMVSDKPIIRMNFSSYKERKPVIVDINTMHLNLTKGNVNNLEGYLKEKDKIQSLYEEAIDSSQRFVIRKLDEMKQKYYPTCCENASAFDRLNKKDHTHFEFKIIQLLNTLQNYLENNIKITRSVLEIKLT